MFEVQNSLNVGESICQNVMLMFKQPKHNFYLTFTLPPLTFKCILSAILAKRYLISLWCNPNKCINDKIFLQIFLHYRLISNYRSQCLQIWMSFWGISITPKQTVAIMKRLKAVLAVENWVGTACVLETASRRVSIGGELRGLINEAVWWLQY